MRILRDPYATFHALVDTPLKRGLLSGVLILSAVSLPFLLVPFEDFRYGDEPYQAYCCAHYERAYLGMLSFFAGNLWMKAFGQTIVSLRVLMTVCYILSAAIGCAYVRHRGFSILKTAAVFLTCTFGITLSYLPLYGWDAGAYPYTALGILSALMYLERPGWKYAAAIGLSAALMTLARLPLAAYLPLCLAVMFLRRRTDAGGMRPWMKDAAVVLVTFLLTAIALTTIMTGSPMNYLGSIKPENTVAAHSINDADWIIDRCVKLAYAAYPMLMPGCVALLLSVIFSKAKRGSAALALFAVAALYYALRGAVWNLGDLRYFFWSNSGIIITAAFVTMFFGPLHRLTKPVNGGCAADRRRISPMAASVILATFALLQAFGSNSLVERIGWGLAMTFGFGVFSREFLHTPRFTFYFISFTAAVTFGFFVLKARTLSQVYGEPVRLNYATVYNGTRPFGDEYHVVESIDSIKFLSDNTEAMGMRQVVVGRAASCYNFGIGEKGINAGILFDVYTEDLYRDYRCQNAENDAEIVVCLNVDRDSVFETYLGDNGYNHYFSTYYPCLSVWVKDSAAGMLPQNPFTQWGYRPGRLPGRDG